MALVHHHVPCDALVSVASLGRWLERDGRLVAHETTAPDADADDAGPVETGAEDTRPIHAAAGQRGTGAALRAENTSSPVVSLWMVVVDALSTSLPTST
jgi:hypothetical protein